MVTDYRGHRLTLFPVGGIKSMCISNLWQNSLDGHRPTHVQSPKNNVHHIKPPRQGGLAALVAS